MGFCYGCIERPILPGACAAHFNETLILQKADKFMSHDKAVLAMNFTRDGDHMVTGDLDGKVILPLFALGQFLHC